MERLEPHLGAPARAPVPPPAAPDGASAPPEDDRIARAVRVADDFAAGGREPVEDDAFEGEGPVEHDVFEGKKGPVEDDVFDPDIEETIARVESGEIAADVDSGAVVVLTAPHGDFGHFSENLRKSAALFRQDGQLHLHVVRGHRRDHEVRALYEALRAAGEEAVVGRIVERDAASIAAIYARAQALFGEEDATAEELQEMEVRALALLRFAAQEGATDIHVQVSLRRCQIRIRVDGDMQEVDKFTLTPDEGRRLLRALFAMAENAEPTYKPTESQDAGLGGEHRGDLPSGIDAVRIKYIPLSQNGRYASIRLQRIPTKLGDDNEDVDALGYEEDQLAAIRRIRRRPQGCCVVCGPTGSGKSRTLQCIVDAIARETQGTKTIFTVEDPVEYPLRGAAQRPVITRGSSEERKAKFQQAVNDLLRQDPDIIMISELRDGESARMFFTIAQTGHLTLSTLHANSALAALMRMRDEGVESFKLRDSTLVVGLVAQRLVPVLCPNCSVPLSAALESEVDATRDAAVAIAAKFDAMKKDYSAVRLRGPGCDHAAAGARCKKGYFGRRVVAEVVEPDDTLLELADRDLRRLAHRYWLEHRKGRTMLEVAIERAAGGEIDPNDVERIIGPIEIDLARARIYDQPLPREYYEQRLESQAAPVHAAATEAA